MAPQDDLNGSDQGKDKDLDENELDNEQLDEVNGGRGSGSEPPPAHYSENP